MAPLSSIAALARYNVLDSIGEFTTCLADFRRGGNLCDFDPTAAEPILVQGVFGAGR